MTDRFASQAQAKLALLRQASELRPTSADALCRLASALAEAGDDDGFADAFRRAFLLNPSLRLMGQDPSDLLRSPPSMDRTSAAIRMRERARSLIDRGVNFSPVIGELAIAESVLGGAEQVARLVDYDRFFRTVILRSPDGFEGDFHGVLAAELRAGMKRHRLPWSAIKEARRNSQVMESALPASRAITAAIRAEVERYIARLPADDPHPFIAARPGAFVMSGWSVVFDGSSRHIAHTHPRAWLSGVYYVVRPAASRRPGARNGWLRVGPPTDRATPGWDERWVEPEAGSLVLMPSYFYHETTPTRSEEERLCIAFDVMSPELSPAPAKSSIMRRTQAEPRE